MSQDKAASLTSALFARKGRASPARLLITELEDGGEAPGVGADLPTDLHDAHGGAPLKRSALELNGRTGRRKTTAAEGDLPLLAFVEAQIAAEGGQSAAEPVAGGEEPGPAASLLARGAPGLRRANGTVLDDEEIAPAPWEAREEAAEVIEAEDVSAAEEIGEPIEPETVSGDSQVTAIEDAPADEAAGEPQDEQLDAGLGAAEEEKNEAPAAAEQPQTPPAESHSAELPSGELPSGELPSAELPSAELKVATDAAISATLAFRHAAAQRAESAAGARRQPRSMPAPAVTERRVPWRGPAVVALGVALGLGAYIFLAGPADETTQLASKPVTEALPTATPEPEPAPAPQGSAAVAADASMGPAGEASVATSQPVAAMVAAGQADEAPALPEPSFDIIRIEPDGQSIIAGRAAPFSEWILLNNDDPIASVKADANGEWVVLPDASLVPGANAFSLVPKTERGKVAIPAPTPTPTPTPTQAVPQETPPEPAEQDGPQAGAAPAGPEARLRAKGGRDVALPQRKPPVPPAEAAPVYQTTEAGSYQVQFASVRQSDDAKRELARLATTFPGLLGQLDLRVQEAAVEGAGTFYRVRSGAMAHLGEAREVCRRLEGEGQGCLVVKLAAPLETPGSETKRDAEEARPEPSAAPHQQAERP